MMDAPFRFKARQWTNKECLFLANNYHSMSDVELVESLGRTLKAIKQKASKLGLKKNVKKRKSNVIEFTWQEIIDIGNYYMNHSNHDCAAKFLVPESVIMRMAQLYRFNKAEDYVRTRTNTFRHREWTEDEIRVLKQMFPHTKTQDIPVHHPTHDIKQKACELGLRKTEEHKYKLRHDFGWALRSRLPDKSINSAEWVKKLKRMNLGDRA